MLNTCVKCKKYSVKKQISSDGIFMTCPLCEHRQEIKRMSLFIITGASGVGKSAVATQLFQKEKDYIVMESDILWDDTYNVPENNYREYRELWLRMCKNIAQIGKPVVLCGCSVPEQFENCLERRYFSEIHYIAIVCDEDVLYKRLTEYRGYEDQQYVKGSISFNTWIKENADKTQPSMQLLDNSHLTVDETAKIVEDWIYGYINK
jgi:adenylate kinase family enzyme